MMLAQCPGLASQPATTCRAEPWPAAMFSPTTASGSRCASPLHHRRAGRVGVVEVVARRHVAAVHERRDGERIVPVERRRRSERAVAARARAAPRLVDEAQHRPPGLAPIAEVLRDQRPREVDAPGRAAARNADVGIAAVEQARAIVLLDLAQRRGASGPK
jgi:hypothetical protein